MAFTKFQCIKYQLPGSLRRGTGNDADGIVDGAASADGRARAREKVSNTQ